MKKYIFRIPLWIFTIVMVFLPVYSSTSHAVQNQTGQRHVLLLHSYHKGMTWVDDITNSVTATLNKTYPGTELHVEYMDTKRVMGDEHLGNLYAEYRFKFRQERFDAVIIADDSALRFALKYYDDLFPGTPVVFCGINNLEPGMLDNRPEFTGVLENVDVADTLKIALALHPDARRVYVINDLSASGRGLHKEIAKAASAFATRAEFVFLEDYTADELAAIISKLPPNNIILRSAFWVDKSGRSLPNEKISYAAVGSGATVPVYSLWDFYMGLGIVGGKMISGSAQGELAARLATRILNGEKPSAIPVVVKSPNRLMFDYRQMQRFGIDRSSLPPESSVINEPLPFYAINKGLAWTGMLFTVAMASVTILLILNIRRRKRTEEILLTLKDTLQEQNEELQVNDESLRDQNDELMATEEMLRIQINEYETSRKLLKDSEARYRSIIKASPDDITITDLTGRILMVSPVALTLFRCKHEDELLGHLVTDFIVPEDRDRAADYVSLMFRGVMSGSGECHGLRSDGSTFDMEVNGKFIQDAEGHSTSIIFILRDITNRKEYEKEQLKMEKLESLGILAGGIAHDFNNILTGIMGNISLARMFLEIDHNSCKPLAEAEKASARAAALAHQLLTFARGGEPVKKEISIQQLVNETVSLVLHGSNVMGTVDIPDSTHAIEADEGQISQVFHNIIINATQAMPEGGILTITAQNENLYAENILALPGGSYVRLSFTDQGSGISDDTMEKIFDPYFTTKSTGKGLGLASVHSIVSRHGGHICASSVPGKGTTFTIHLPSISAIYSKQTADLVTQSTGDHAGGSILVMDDEEMIRDMTTEMLKHLGYQVTTCENGVEAITRYMDARESGMPFSAVIMDLTIPGGMGGRETAERVLAIDPEACLIVSSGYSNDPIMSDYSSFGFIAAMSKPYNIKELGQQLSLLLASRQTHNTTLTATTAC